MSSRRVWTRLIWRLISTNFAVSFRSISSSAAVFVWFDQTVMTATAMAPTAVTTALASAIHSAILLSIL